MDRIPRLARVWRACQPETSSTEFAEVKSSPRRLSSLVLRAHKPAGGLLAAALAASILLTGIGNSGVNGVKFVDAVAGSRITFFHQSAPEKKYLVESMSGGVLLFDYDNDGWQDVYFVNSLTVDTASDVKSSRSQLYRNNHDGTFSDVSDAAGVAYPGWGMGGCAGDYDGDGNLDLYITALGPNRLYRNRGDGTFEEVAAKMGTADDRYSAGCAFGDYDNDGDLDLFVSNYVDYKLDDLPEFGKGSLCQYKGIPVQCGPRGLPGAGDALFRNDGGSFTDVSKAAGVSDPDGYYGLGVVWTDVDGDGWIDLFVANDSRPNFLYRNKRDGTFEEVGFLAGVAVSEDGSEQGSMGVAVGDYNHDQKLDLFVTNFSEEYNALYRLDHDFVYSDTSFASRTAEASFPYVGWGAEFVDYDNDGWLDLIAVNGHVYPQVDGASLGTSYRQAKLVYRNQRDGTFVDETATVGEALAEKRVSRGAAFGDIDNDGDIDVVVNDLDGKPMVLLNEGGNRGNWVRITAQGAGKNRFAFGAKVKVVSGDLTQISEIRSGGSYISQNDIRLHFGLGDRRKLDLIEIRWPDGKTTKMENVEPVNREIALDEESN